MLYDSHLHLDDRRYNGKVLQEVMARVEKEKMGFLLNPGCDEPSSARAVELSEIYPIVYAAVGFHPGEARKWNSEKHTKMIRKWATYKKVLAIGEIGLDYHYDDGPPKKLQKQVFEEQMDIANLVKLPIIIHDREAHQDVLDMVKSCFNLENGIQFHSFSGSLEMAKQVLDMGGYLSFSGPLTFKNNKKGPEVVKFAPLNRLLIETDSPYLTPEPHRGTMNEPAYVRYVAEKMAELRGITVDEVLETTFQNAKDLFKF